MCEKMKEGVMPELTMKEVIQILKNNCTEHVNERYAEAMRIAYTELEKLEDVRKILVS